MVTNAAQKDLTQTQSFITISNNIVTKAAQATLKTSNKISSMRGRAVVARKVHTLDVVVSNPTCAITNIVAICRIEQTRSRTSV